jgi:hypothetical protein
MNKMPEQNPNPKQTEQISRPDPVFKHVTLGLAQELGLRVDNTEFPQTFRADLILGVPPDRKKALRKTLFEFFRDFNVIEYKSQGDLLDKDGYLTNEIRTALLILKNPEATHENTLNVIVSSRYPQDFFDYMEEKKYKFKSTKSKPWLYRCRVGLQEVRVIVCRDLPFERKYYRWLIFVPSDNPKWQEFVKILFKEREEFYLDLLRQMRPKEYYMTIETLNIDELVSELSPEEQAERRQDLENVRKAELRLVRRISEALGISIVEDIGELIEDLKPEEVTVLVQKLTPEQRQQLIEALLKMQNSPKDRQQN